MRYLVFLSILILWGCSSTENACSGVNCSDWEECELGSCELKAGYCRNNGDCTGTDICYTETHLCGARDLCADKVCSEWQYCVLGSCLLSEGRCDDRTDCTGEQFCNDTHYCANLCEHSSCDSNWQECVPSTGACIAKDGFCDHKDDCNSDLECNQITHLCQAGDPCADISCSNWEECDGGLCKPLDGRCNIKTDCDIGLICNGQHNCEDLCLNSSCDTFEWCDPESGSCEVKEGFCKVNGDCLGVLLCSSVRHRCEENTPCLEVSCESWESCNVTNGSCELLDGYCSTEDDCSENYEICNEQHLCEIDAIEITEFPDTFDGTVSFRSGALYKFELKAGERINFKAIFLHSKGDIDLYLFVDNLGEQIYSTYSSTDNEVMEWIALKDGTYYLEILNGDESENTYTLIVDNKNSCSLDGELCPIGSYCGSENSCMVRLDCETDLDCKDEVDILGNSFICAPVYLTPKCVPSAIIEENESKSGSLPLYGNDWYLIDLPEDGSIDLTLSFTEGAANITLYDDQFEVFESVYLYNDADRLLYLSHIPKGVYYINITQRGNDATAYTLTTGAFTSGLCTQNSDCYNSEPLRSICNSDGFCESNTLMVAEGEVCESTGNCTSGYQCYDYEPGASGIESTCRPECELDSDCSYYEWCYRSSILLLKGICIESCIFAGGDQYCQDLLNSSGATCDTMSGGCNY